MGRGKNKKYKAAPPPSMPVENVEHAEWPHDERIDPEGNMGAREYNQAYVKQYYIDEEEYQRSFREDLPKYKKIPKVELHAHLAGSLSRYTIVRLMNNDSEAADIIKNKYVFKEGTKRKHDAFPIVNLLLQKKENIDLAIDDVCDDFAKDNCIYLELRTSPQESEHYCYYEYIQYCVEAIKRNRETHPKMKIFLVLVFSRDMHVALVSEFINCISDFQLESNIIAGIDLYGPGDGTEYIPFFTAARMFLGLGLTVHLAEQGEFYGSDWLDFLAMKPDRISHGALLHTDEVCRESLAVFNIPLEVCLMSNAVSGVCDVEKTHAKYWSDRGHPLVFCTDEPAITGSNLSMEYWRAARHLKLDMDDLMFINLIALKHSFGHKKMLINLKDMLEVIDNALIS